MISVSIFFLIISISIDTLISGLSYGINKIKIPFRSSFILNLISSLILFISMLLGKVIDPYFNDLGTTYICKILFFSLGTIKIIESLISYIKRQERQFKFKLSNIELIFNIYKNPEVADIDKSKTLSMKESIFLATALSLDNFALGIGIGLMTNSIIMTILVNLIVGIIMLLIGCMIGKIISKKIKVNCTWVGGLILIIMSILKH